jgi:hypothetical protein
LLTLVNAVFAHFADAHVVSGHSCRSQTADGQARLAPCECG